MPVTQATPAPKQSVVKPPEVKPITSLPLAKGAVPPVPKGVPPVPKIPIKPVIIPPKAQPHSKAKDNGKDLTLMEQIQKGVQLKKVETIEKTGLDYLKKKSTVSSNNNKPMGASDMGSSNTETSSTTPAEKGNLFDEMRRVQLKKIEK